MPKVRIAPSILSSDFAHLADEIAAVEQAGADLVHVDVMDGHFVPNLTIGPPIVEALRKVTALPLDVHLMMTNPDAFIREFAEAGATYLTVHVEACPHLHRTVRSVLLEVDGGVKVDNAAAIVAAGADILVAGSAIFEAPGRDYRRVIAHLRRGSAAASDSGDNGKPTAHSKAAASSRKARR